MKHWNKCVAENERMVASNMLIGIAKGESELGFELGQQVMHDLAEGEKEFEDAIEDVMVEAMGDGARLPDWAKERVKEYRTRA